MKRWHALLPNWAISILLTLIVTISLISSYYGSSVVTKVVTLVIIPLLLIAYFYKQKVMANIFYTIFVLYFLGMFLTVFEIFNLSSELAEASFFGAYILLIFVIIGKLKHMKFEGLVSGYLVLILLVNSYFLFIMFNSIKDSFGDSVILTLSVARGIALLIMALLAFAIYLSKETSQSIIFLMVVCCFAFSDVLSFITTMYIHFWLFEAVQNIIQGAGLLLFCIYVFNYQEIAKRNKSKRVAQSNHMTIRS